MIILNLINVIAIAMGIGTSAKSTNLDVENKHRRNAIQTINEQVDLVNTNQANQYDQINANGSVENHTIRKYLIGSDSNPNYYRPYANFYNTVYSDYRIYEITEYNYIQVQCTTWALFAVTNYYPSQLRFKLEIQNVIGTATTGTQYEYSYNTSSTLEQYIDMSLTQSTRNTLDTYENSIQNDRIFSYTQSISTNSNSDYVAETQTPYITLAAQETKYIMMKLQISYTAQNSVTVLSNIPTKFKIVGEVMTPDDTREIVDVPGLMFTVLTLPFSFISQAFNLTIFPGTPYAVNFTNLFMTILAIFILIWIIKHIFK